MNFTKKEVILLREHLRFLDEWGYAMIDRKESIDYINEGIAISVCNQHFSEHAEIIIRHTEVNGEITTEIF